MRRFCLLLTAIACAVAAVDAPTLAAPSCAAPADQSTYEVLSLREQMVLLATKCGRVDDYNNYFIKRFQPELQANDRAVLAYFRRVYGSAGQGQKDRFTTELVNVMSGMANAQGAQYCGRAGLIVGELVALRSMAELAPYAAVKDFSPAGTSMCPRGR